MANTLTGLIPTIYEAMDVISRELVGLIPAVTLDAAADRAAVGQTITTHAAPTGTAEDITPASDVPDTGDQTIAPITLSITKSRAVPFRWTGDEELSVGGSGPGAQNIRRDQMVQAMRVLTNEVESDLAGLHIAFSRAYGTAATTPFASSLGDSAQVRKILKDNGTPEGDLHLVMDTTAGANLRTLTQLTKANEAGSTEPLRRGVLLDLHGMAIRESAQIASFTNGTGTGYLVDLVAGYAVGDTLIHVDTGTGTIIAGDFVTFAGDTNKYLVTVGFAGDGDGDITIAAPGLRQTLVDDTAMTIGGDHVPNMAFHRSALILLARAPALPAGGDRADDHMVVTDPVSGLSFDFASYSGYYRRRYQVGLAWGVKCIKPAHTAVLLG